MNHQIIILIWSAISIAFIHTLLGPDHYLPFIALGKAKKWSIRKSTIITTLCGLGHVLSSVLIGLGGLYFCTAINKVEFIEGFRGDIAAWLLTSFGFIYFIYGVKKVIKNKRDNHTHNIEIQSKSKTVPWVLFIIFAFGPCEPLIPILIYPAAKESVIGLFIVIISFTTVTILTMLGMVLISLYGLHFAFINKLEKYSHAFAGLILLLSGIAILAGL